ncbi:GD19811 [Drosophila simulans]|uniref:GD19811 n=1 Tax=Drosophila simulans TaxID=7240 RepID=B4QX07_DROSI|nr:GD19811 [Drosophila simulans]
MKTRLVSLTFRGSASVDPRYSASMLPWTINDIRSTESYTKITDDERNGKKQLGAQWSQVEERPRRPQV